MGPGSNRAPEIRNVTVSPSSVAAPGTATVRVEAVDPEGDQWGGIGETRFRLLR